jgi:hypothetical protein
MQKSIKLRCLHPCGRVTPGYFLSWTRANKVSERQMSLVSLTPSLVFWGVLFSSAMVVILLPWSQMWYVPLWKLWYYIFHNHPLFTFRPFIQKHSVWEDKGVLWYLQSIYPFPLAHVDHGRGLGE